MRIATWNLNNRVGKVRFRPEAARAAIGLDADLLVLTEFYPQEHERAFRTKLEDAGWAHQIMSADMGEVANRVLVASRVRIESLDMELPEFDMQFPSNLIGVHVPSTGLSIVAVRIPAYSGSEKSSLARAWDWLEQTARALRDRPAVILGDLNVASASPASRGGDHFRRILGDGWKRAQPLGGASFYGHGNVRSEIDHILGTKRCEFDDAAYVLESGAFRLSGTANSLSDHAALVCQVKIQQA
ncbi:MAG: endonuclease/exonuclease/phosphatase family protein [Ideonella sp.]|nr:endonuclease/exonuclease/phosphatase family protein [Ideonella sp.]